MNKKSRGKLSTFMIIGEGIDVIVDNFKELFILACIFIAIPSLLIMGSTFGTIGNFQFNSTNYTIGIYKVFNIGTIILLSIISLLSSVWTTAGTFGIIKFVHDKCYKENITWKEAIKFSFCKIGKSILFILFSFIIGIVIGLAIGILSALLTLLIFAVKPGLGWTTFIILLAIIAIFILLIIFGMYIVFMNQGIAIKNLGVWESFKYSISMVNGRLGNVYLKQLVLGVIVLLVGMILEIFNFIPYIGMLIIALGSSILSVYSICYTTLMFDDYDEEDNNK